MLLLVKRIYFVFALFVCLLIIQKSLEYYIPNFEVGFLIGKSSIFPIYKLFLYSHIIGAPIALLTGLFQFSYRKSNLHRRVGLIYVSSILLLAGPGGLGMSFYALGGTLNIINFLLLSTLWLITTFLAFYYAKQKDYEKHRSMMIRSFILTNSAILIRLFSYINHELLIFEIEIGYIIISWISWLPALLTYELVQMKKRLTSD
ncbi:DUF2306 domain-containing protein [Ekhidna sp.]|uniref:DUF2306 domain-containing protein n=1 Tax=Ekhidna sp. TaxID=2608089 RepID=UPI0032EB5CD5